MKVLLVVFCFIFYFIFFFVLFCFVLVFGKKNKEKNLCFFILIRKMSMFLYFLFLLKNSIVFG